jgi:hypothetical protein
MGWFLTYPQCDLTPDEALGHLRALPIKAAIETYVIAREAHKEGGFHIHAWIKYASKVSVDDKYTRWDIAGYHGNYQKAHNWAKCRAYCQKDGNFISNFDVDAAKAKKAAFNKKLLLEDPVAMVDNGDISLYQIKSLLQAKAIYHSLKAPAKVRAEGLVANTFGRILPIFDSKVKQRHWWFWSRAPNTGKTTFLKDLDMHYPSHWMAREEFQTIHPGTQFVLLDEYTTPYLTAFQVNQMCDGTYQYPFKGGSPVQLKDPILVVASNKPPEEVYPHQYELINARFCVFELK